MSRQAREKSEIGIYLVNLKSVEDVSFSKEEKLDFLNIMANNHVCILSYTFFNNSFVFVLKEDERTIDIILRQCCIKFVKSYNKKHDRSGKIFAGRYTSFSAQTMDDVCNFISNTHIMRKIDDENITSFDDYLKNKFIDSKYVLSFFNNKEEFNEKCNGLYLSEDSLKLSDEEVENYIINNFQIQPSNIVKMPETILQNTIIQVFKFTKASARQIARITSLPLNFLWNIAKKIKGENKKNIEFNEKQIKLAMKNIKNSNKKRFKNKKLKPEKI